MLRATFLPSMFLVALVATAAAHAQSCGTPAADVIGTLNLPGAPFSAIPTPDGCTIFVSLTVPQDRTTPGHIAVLNRAAGQVMLVHDVPVPSQGGLAGMAISHDGNWLVAATGSGVVLLDAKRLADGDGKPIAAATDRAGPGPRAQAGSVYVALSPDDTLLFVSDEGTASITVYRLAKAHGEELHAMGRIPVGIAPVGLVFSPDGRRLYTTSEIGRPGEVPVSCPGEGGRGGTTPQGLLTVIDVVRAATDPTASVLAKVAAGCDPVRVTLSQDGTRAWVTARGANSLLVFDTSKLIANPGRALTATVAVGNSPVGVAVAGHRVVTADSNRFAPPGRPGEWLSVIDSDTYQVIGAVPAGLFPRELWVTADGNTLLVTNFRSRSLEWVDLARLTPAYFAETKAARP